MTKETAYCAACDAEIGEWDGDLYTAHYCDGCTAKKAARAAKGIKTQVVYAGASAEYVAAQSDVGTASDAAPTSAAGIPDEMRQAAVARMLRGED